MHSLSVIRLLAVLAVAVLIGDARKPATKSTAKTVGRGLHKIHRHSFAKHLVLKKDVIANPPTVTHASTAKQQATAAKSTVTKEKPSKPSDIEHHSSHGTRKNVIHDPLLSRLYMERAEALKRAEIINAQIKQLLDRSTATPDLPPYMRLQESSSTPSILVSETSDPATGAFNVQGGAMVLGPANAGAVSGLMAGAENADTRSTVNQKASSSSKDARKKSAPSLQNSHTRHFKVTPSIRKSLKKSDALTKQAQQKSVLLAERAHHKSDLYGTSQQSYVLYPDSNKIVPIPDNAEASNTAVNMDASPVADTKPPANNMFWPSPFPTANNLFSPSPSSSANNNYPNAESANIGGTLVPFVTPQTSNAPVDSSNVNTGNTDNGVVPIAADNQGASAQIAESGVGDAILNEHNTEEDEFDADDYVLGDPKKFAQNCAVLKLTFERSQGDIIFDDSLKANDAQLENGAFVSDETAKSGLAMNLGQQGYLQLANKFKAKPRKAVAISMWVRLNDVQGNNSLFRAVGNDVIHYDLAVVDGKGLWVHRGDDGKELFRVESNEKTALTPGTWHHILGSYSAKEGKASLWVDGEETGTKSGISGDLSLNWDKVKMFEGKTSGIVDNVFMFRCPLDRTKIIALYVAAASPKDAKKKTVIPRPKHK